MTDPVVTFGTRVGADYSDWDEWQLAQAGDLVQQGINHRLQWYNDWPGVGFPFYGNAVDSSSWNTGPSNQIYIEPVPGEGHTGDPETGVFWQSALVGGPFYVFRVSVPYVNVEGMDIRFDGGVRQVFDVGAANFSVRRTIVRVTESSTSFGVYYAPIRALTGLLIESSLFATTGNCINTQLVIGERLQSGLTVRNTVLDARGAGNSGLSNYGNTANQLNNTYQNVLHWGQPDGVQQVGGWGVDDTNNAFETGMASPYGNAQIINVADVTDVTDVTNNNFRPVPSGKLDGTGTTVVAPLDLEGNPFTGDHVGAYNVGGAPPAEQVDPDDLDQSQTIDPVTLVQAHLVKPDPSIQAQSLDNIDLSVLTGLSVNPLAQEQTLDAVTLTQAHIVVTESLAQNQQLDNVLLTIQGAVTPDPIAQSQSLGTVALIVAGNIVADKVNQGQSLDTVTLQASYSVEIQELLQGQTLGNVDLVVEALRADDLSQQQVIDNVNLVQHHILAVDKLTQQQIIDIVSLGGVVFGELDGEILCYSSLQGTVETVH